jgi:hypothetical protein
MRPISGTSRVIALLGGGGAVRCIIVCASPRHRAIASGASLLPTFAVTTVVVAMDPTSVVINRLMVTPSQTIDGELVIEV